MCEHVLSSLGASIRRITFASCVNMCFPSWVRLNVALLLLHV